MITLHQSVKSDSSRCHIGHHNGSERLAHCSLKGFFPSWVNVDKVQ
jgi:hypothetical protein